jgi:predicted nucleic acid-binding protein
MSGNKYLLDTNVIIGFLAGEIEDEAIAIRRAARLKLPDAIIAATALTSEATLVSADDDFSKVNDLAVLNPASK